MPENHRTDADEPEDGAVVEKVLYGRTDDFEILLTRYRGYIFKIVSGLLPPDAVADSCQDIFIDIFRSLNNFDQRKNFRKWIAGIAVHRCHDYWRMKYRNREIPESELTAEHRDWVASITDNLAREHFDQVQQQKEAREIIQHALAGLSVKDRIVLTLVHLEGLPVKEVAEILDWSLVNVKVRAHRSRTRLHKVLSAMLEGANNG